ncbi:MAG: hypothetical protein LBH65_02310 [Desulfovibrio sp.]|jgi:hypothetical protein|nr:hypothetical protein [Desulfovibrio sp.]
MRPSGRPRELFEAFSRINARAFADERLLSCPLLSKAPNYGGVLERFLRQQPPPGTAAPASGPVRLALTALRYAAANGLHCVFMLFCAMALRLMGAGSPEDLAGAGPGERLLLLDTFAVLPGIAADGVYQERYLPGLAEAAKARGWLVLPLYRLYGSRNPAVAWKALRVLAASGGLCDLQLLTFADWLLLIRHALLYPFSLWRLARALRGHEPGSPEFCIRAALLESAGQCVLSGEARRLAGRRLGLLLAAGRAKRGGEPLLVSWYENQTVNKAFYRGLAQAEAKSGFHVRTIGAQLFVWPGALLNNHPDDAEAALGLAPDKALVNGAFFLPEDSARPYAVGPALRYAHLYEPGRSQPRAPKRNRDEKAGAVLVLLSYHPAETRRVLKLALGMARSGQELLYRFHPATRREDFADLLPGNALFSYGALGAALASASAVLGAGSGTLAEAAALGVPVLFADEDEPDLALNYLPEEGRGLFWERVTRPEDAAAALERLERARSSPDHGARAATLKESLFAEPTADRIREAFEL